MFYGAINYLAGTVIWSHPLGWYTHDLGACVMHVYIYDTACDSNVLEVLQKHSRTGTH